MENWKGSYFPEMRRGYRSSCSSSSFVRSTLHKTWCFLLSRTSLLLLLYTYFFQTLKSGSNKYFHFIIDYCSRSSSTFWSRRLHRSVSIQSFYTGKVLSKCNGASSIIFFFFPLLLLYLVFSTLSFIV